MELAINVEERTFLRKIEWNLILVIFGLNVVGLITLYSATHGPHSQTMEPLFFNQILWLIMGWSLFFIITFIDYSLIAKLTTAFYLFNLSAIVFTSFYGKTALGAQRWIDLGFFRYQPSETMKLALILMLAKWFSHRGADRKGMGIKELLFPLIIIGLPFIFVVKQPDLGTAMMIAAISGTVLLFMKIKIKIIIFVFSLVSIAVPLAWKYGFRDYQKARITNFISPNSDPQGAGYNSIQSKIAVGSGKIVGKGFRKGTQSQLEFLPERHTDFIYSVLSEEHGFIGCVLTLTLFCLLFVILTKIASTAREKLGSLIVVGVSGYLFWHMFINIGMVIGLLPIVGVPLPLISYGGSGMLTTMLGLGFVSSVAYRRYLF